MTKNKTKLLYIAVLMVLSLGTSRAAVWLISPVGGHFTTIQKGNDTSIVAPGDTLWVIAPIHTEAGIAINKNLTIIGNGKTATIVQADTAARIAKARVMAIANGTTVFLRDLTIRYGMDTGAPTALGGGIYNSGSLDVDNCLFYWNTAVGTGGAAALGSAYGGGIYNDGGLTVTNSTLQGNMALGGNSCLDMSALGAGAYGGAIANAAGCFTSVAICSVFADTAIGGAGLDTGGVAYGGGLYNNGIMDIVLTIIDSCYCTAGMTCLEEFGTGGDAYGGGTANDHDAVMTVIQTTVKRNTVEGGFGVNQGGNGYGGGMYNDGTIDIVESTLHCNYALGGSAFDMMTGMDFPGDGYGGGVANEDNMTYNATNVTISTNTAMGGIGFNSGMVGVGWGGGAWAGNALFTMNVTVAKNLADYGGGICSQHTSGNAGPDLKNTIIADDTVFITGHDIYQNIQSDGYNVIEDTVGGTIDTAAANNNTGAGNILGQDPSLGNLAFNGGPTETHALLMGSIAIDGGDFNGAPINDQRQYQRVGQLDIGAYEYGGSVPVVLTSFTAQVQGAGVVLAWTTASEQDNLGYNVLRSASKNGAYSRINQILIPGAGTTGQPQGYTYTDVDVLSGTWYYRLEQIDAGGGSVLSGPIAIAVGTTGLTDRPFTLAGYSPVRDLLARVRLPQAETVRVTVSDMTGQIKAVLGDGRYPAGQHVFRRPKGLVAGLYFIHLDGTVHDQMIRVLIVE